MHHCYRISTVGEPVRMCGGESVGIYVVSTQFAMNLKLLQQLKSVILKSEW